MSRKLFDYLRRKEGLPSLAHRFVEAGSVTGADKVSGEIQFGEVQELELKRLAGLILVYPVDWH